MNQTEVRQHVTILGWLHIAAAALAVVVGLGLLLLFGGIGLAEHDREARTFMAIIGFCVAVFLFLLSIPGLLAGYGLLKHRPWGRILALVVGALHLASFPAGTALGVYAFVILLKPEAEAFFRSA
jgi:hypothetical protein